MRFFFHEGRLVDSCSVQLLITFYTLLHRKRLRIQMKLCSYVVKYDHGFAPNPYWNYCTVACCKGRYRKSLKEGDWLVGTSSKTRHGTGTRLIYAMKITELLSFRDYSSDSRFRA